MLFGGLIADVDCVDTGMVILLANWLAFQLFPHCEQKKNFDNRTDHAQSSCSLSRASFESNLPTSKR